MAVIGAEGAAKGRENATSCPDPNRMAIQDTHRRNFETDEKLAKKRSHFIVRVIQQSIPKIVSRPFIQRITGIITGENF